MIRRPKRMNVTGAQLSRLAAVVAVAVVAAGCGEAGTSSSPTSPADGLRPPVPVHVSGAGGDTGGVAEMSTMADGAADVAAADPSDTSARILPAFGGYEFVVGDGLPPLPTDATGYQYPANAEVGQDVVARLAAALGISGDPVEGDPAIRERWRVGPEDGTAPALVVGADAQLSWYYQFAWAVEQVDDVCARSSVAEGEAAPDPCATPEPPANVPTAAAAEERVRTILTEAGIDPARFTYESYADEWSASVTALEQLGGLTSPVGWSFGFGGEGVLQWASGSLATPVAVGPYPLVDVETAVARLTDQSGIWGPLVAATDAGSAVEPAVDVPVDVPAIEPAVEPAVEPLPTDTVLVDPPVDVPAIEPLPTDTVLVDPPVEPPVEPEVVVATLVDVRADLWWAWDADGTVWLLPAYTFTDTEGLTHTAPAVTDEFLIVEPAAEVLPVDAPPAEPAD